MHIARDSQHTMSIKKLRLRYTDSQWDALYKEAEEKDLSIGVLIHHKLLKEFGGVKPCFPCEEIKVKKHIDVELPEFIVNRMTCHASATSISFNSLASNTIIK